jgi:hypothetical protein
MKEYQSAGLVEGSRATDVLIQGSETIIVYVFEEKVTRQPHLFIANDIDMAIYELTPKACLKDFVLR